jgi:hypothetical protein
MSDAFAPIVRARPDPIFGRPVHPGFPPNRLHTLRIPPRGGHPVLRSTSIGGSRSVLLVSGFRLRASKRLHHTFLSLRPARRYPAFGYGAPHPSAGGTLTLLIHALLSARYGSLRPCASLRYSYPHGDRPFGCLPLHRGDRFPRSTRKPDVESRRLHAGCRLGSNQAILRHCAAIRS